MCLCVGVKQIIILFHFVTFGDLIYFVQMTSSMSRTKHILCFLFLFLFLLERSNGANSETKKNVKQQPAVRADHSNAKHVEEKIEDKMGHVLFFHNAGTRSHLIAMNALARGLSEHGYQVTSVHYAKSNIVNANFNEILIEDR